ncbi:MAG: RloB domain-containing protein [Clostridiales bacterium]|nr:RloB domain-containing protein [Clostridiales bacterium]
MRKEYNPDRAGRRKRRPVIYIICEGKETEINYFRHFRTRRCLVDVVPISSKHTAAEHLVKHARALISHADYFPKDGDQIWCVFDCDENSDYCLITCNHDTVRPKYNLSDEELKLAYAFIFTMPGVPFLYYGDEIGMRYLNIPTKEGGYFRTGARTPMQWTKGKNAGFSTSEADALYLPVDPMPDAPSVESQEAEADSLLHTVKALLALRHAEEDLQADAEFAVVYAESGKLPFVYRRGDILIALNPSTETVTAPVDAAGRDIVFSVGRGIVEDGVLTLGKQSCMVLK